MKKTLSLLVVAFATCLMMFAEDPGLYLKKGDALTPVKVTRLSNTKKGGSAGAFSIGKEEHKIKGVTSGLTYAKDDSLIFVFPPKSGKKLKLAGPFTEFSTTANFLLYKLEVTKKERKVSTGVEIMGFNTKENGGAELPFTQLDDTTYEVKLDNLEPGEYALFYTGFNEGGKKAASVFNIDPVVWDEAWCFTVE